MRRTIGIVRDGKYYDLEKGESPEKEEIRSSAYVQDDTMSPLKHLVSGKIFDSKSAYLKECKKLGLDVIGNDLLSKENQARPDKITDSLILDKIEKAESIYNDPTKYRARQEENFRRLERRGELINGH